MKYYKRAAAFLLCVLLCLGTAVESLAYTGVSDWAAEEIANADKLGLIPDSMANVDMSGAMTRQEMCELAVKSFQTLTGTTLYPSSTAHFSDTSNATIHVAYELGIVDGYNDGTFKPKRNITRQEFCKIVGNLFTALGWYQQYDQLSVFTDQKTVSGWARRATANTVALGIVKGNSDGTIAPAAATSSEQALAMFYRCYTYLCNFLEQAPDEGGGEIGSVSGAAGAPSSETRTPVRATGSYTCSTWAEETLQAMATAELVPASLLNANLQQNITREQMCETALLAYNALTGSTYKPKATNHFSDTTSSAVSSAYELKIVNGYPDKTFKPTAVLKREEFFQIISNFLAAMGWTDATAQAQAQLFKSFTDASSVSDWALEPVVLLYQLNILRGNGNGKILPGNNINRQEGISMFMRGYNYIYDWYKAHPLDKIVGPLEANSTADAVVAKAMTYLGYPYVWAAASPAVGFDCSGFTYYVYKQFGYTLGRDAAQQSKNGTYVPRDSLKPGDLLIFSKAGDLSSIGHVAIYIGDGKMIHAQSAATGVCITPVSYYDTRYITARRIIQ